MSMKLRVLAAATAFALASSNGARAETEPNSGWWTMTQAAKPHDSRVTLSLRTQDATGDSWTQSDVDLGRLGLSAYAVTGKSHDICFKLEDDAGRVNFVGTATQGNAAGTFSFAPSTAYLEAVRARGLSGSDDRSVLSAILLDLSIAYVDAMRGSGIAMTKFQNVVALRASGVSPHYASAIHAALGSTDELELLSLAAVHVDSAYIAALVGYGFKDITPRNVIIAKEINLDRAFLRSITSVGYGHISLHDFITFKQMGIDATFIENMRARGFTRPSVQQLVLLKALSRPV